MAAKTADSELDRFMKESSRSYKECKVKNSARRNSLMKKTLNIDMERKLASAERDREERVLREQLRHMQIERTKTTIITNMRGKSGRSKPMKAPPSPRQVPGSDFDPYPVTFGGGMRSRSNTLDEKGKAFAARRGRRQSKEFEDLHVNTATGKLAIPRLASLAGSSEVPSPYSLSPSTSRRNLHGSSSSIDSSGGDCMWAGDPEAIGSVRRPRKSVEEQGAEKLARKSQASEARVSRPE